MLNYQGLNLDKSCMLIAFDNLLNSDEWYDNGREFIRNFMEEFKLGFPRDEYKMLEEAAPVIHITNAQIHYLQGDIYAAITKSGIRYRIPYNRNVVIAYNRGDGTGHAICTPIHVVFTVALFTTDLDIFVKKYELIVDKG